MKKYTKLLGVTFAVGISALIFIFRDQLIALQNYGYLGVFLLSLFGAATILLPLPTAIAVVAAGGVLNPFLVGLFSSVGASFGEMSGYLVGAGGEEVIEGNKKFEKVQGWMKKYGLWTLFILAAIPNPFFDLAGIVAGATKISVWKFLLVIWGGKLIKFMILAYAGFGSIRILGTHFGF